MTVSAAFLAALGVTASFLPREMLVYAGAPPAWFPELMIQCAGAGFIAFAVLNWSARGSMLGGIYGRPIALGNFAQFAIGAITLLKNLSNVRDHPVLVIVTAAYALLAIWFGAVLFGPGPPRRDGV